MHLSGTNETKHGVELCSKEHGCLMVHPVRFRCLVDKESKTNKATVWNEIIHGLWIKLQMQLLESYKQWSMMHH